MIAVLRSFVLAALALSLALHAAGQSLTPPLSTIPVDEITTGMKGIAYTVFEGTKPEPMDIEVLGILRNMAGPRNDVILVRLKGSKPEYTGVVAGMSGSPVYIDGKLAGAIAYRIGEFSKEPIAGVTPIAQMLEISAIDKASTAASEAPARPIRGATPTSGPGLSSDPESKGSFSNMLKPIETPLVFSGFDENAIRAFAPQFTAAGITPVLGAGSVSPETKQPEALQPGSAVSALFVRGDMSIAGTCTVTYIDKEHLLACGHPILDYGTVDMPMTKAEVLATLASPSNSFKIVNATEPVGAFVQDRRTGILGRLGKEPRMIPVTLTFNGAAKKTFHYEVLNNAKITPVAMMATVFNALQGMNEYGEDTTYRLQGQINVAGFPRLALQNMFAPSDGNQPTAMAMALSVGEKFNRIFDNPYETPNIQGVELNFEMVRERRWARLETARTDMTQARPGDELIIETVLRPYRGEQIVRQIPVKIPTSSPKGTLRILVSDGETLDRIRKIGTNLNRRYDLGSTIALLNKEHENSRVYVSLLEANPQATVQDKVMPALPLSVMNVMDGMRGTQDMVVVGESAVTEASTPVDYVVSGSQVITIDVK